MTYQKPSKDVAVADIISSNQQPATLATLGRGDFQSDWAALPALLILAATAWRLRHRAVWPTKPYIIGNRNSPERSHYNFLSEVCVSKLLPRLLLTWWMEFASTVWCGSKLEVDKKHETIAHAVLGELSWKLLLAEVTLALARYWAAGLSNRSRMKLHTYVPPSPYERIIGSMWLSNLWTIWVSSRNI